MFCKVVYKHYICSVEMIKSLKKTNHFVTKAFMMRLMIKPFFLIRYYVIQCTI